MNSVVLRVPDGQDKLREALSAASLVIAADSEGRTDTQGVFAAALSDYARLLEALYAEGYYGGVISILIDGREAAEIPLLNTPTQINTVDIRVNPGPPFRFGQAQVTPLAAGTVLPEEFGPGQRAKAPFVRDAVQTAIDGWREAGHPKARVAGENVSADHLNSTLDTAVAIDPGPMARFGTLVIETPSRVRAAAIRRIAGLPEGARFSPADAEEVAQRLRRTGAFSAVSLQEAETVGPDGSLDMILSVTDMKRRRLGYGLELSSLDGLELSGYWLHRNIFGGAERLRFDASVSNIGGANDIDWALGARIETPAPYGPDTRAFAYLTLEHMDEPTYTSDTITLGFGGGWRVNDRIDVEAAVEYLYSDTTDAFGERTFSMLTFPVSGTYDTRDNTLDPTDGLYVQAELTPFVGLNGTGTGLRSFADARAYRPVGDNVVLAGRFQFGSITGADLDQIYPDFLFYSGGAGTVRGQPFNSLDIDAGGGLRTGGRSFIGASAELRTSFTDTIGGVLFADAGYVGPESFYDGSGEWHAGAGIGLRYFTGIGPIRLDVAAPISGDTGDGVQVYIGIGQAF